MAARAPLPGPSRRREAANRGRGRRAMPLVGGAARLARVRDRRRRRQGHRRRAAAPPRRRRARAAVGDRLEVPADDRGHDAQARSAGIPGSSAICTRTRCSSRCTSAGSRSSRRRSTTRRTSRARTSASGEEVIVLRAGDVIPQVLSPAPHVAERERPPAVATIRRSGARSARRRRSSPRTRCSRSARTATAPAAAGSCSRTSSARWTSTGSARSR